MSGGERCDGTSGREDMAKLFRKVECVIINVVLCLYPTLRRLEVHGNSAVRDVQEDS